MNIGAGARAFIALGANLGDPEASVREAMRRLDDGTLGRVVSRSSLYRSAPVGMFDQPDFVNAMVEMRTHCSPLELMRALLRLEAAMGRIRGERNGPRVIDLDLIAFDSRRFSTDELQLPHPRALQRAFVMLPWSEIAADCDLAGGGKVGQVAAGLSTAQIRRLDA